jgi:transcriptional regulator with XRE-family HTH domain
MAFKPNNIDKLYRDNLVRLMDLHKINQAELGRRTGWSKQLISDYCNLSKGIGKENLLQLCSIFGVEPDEFLIDYSIRKASSRPMNVLSAVYGSLTPEEKLEVLNYACFIKARKDINNSISSPHQNTDLDDNQ